MILDPVYLYCARTGPGVFEEPLSLAATLAFVVSAAMIWRMASGLRPVRWMAGLTLALFPGTALLHLLPSYLTLALPVGLVLLIVLTYFYAVNRDLVGLSARMSWAGTLLILPFAAVSLTLIGLLPGQFGSAAYAPIVILLLGYGAVLRGDHPDTAQGLLASALLLGAALAVRSVDLPLCGVWPHGTHFLWLIMMSVLCWHLARVYRRHMLAGGGGGR